MIARKTDFWKTSSKILIITGQIMTIAFALTIILAFASLIKFFINYLL